MIKVWRFVEAVTLVSSKGCLAAGYKGSEGPWFILLMWVFVVLLNKILKYVIEIQPRWPLYVCASLGKCHFFKAYGLEVIA